MRPPTWMLVLAGVALVLLIAWMLGHPVRVT